MPQFKTLEDAPALKGKRVLVRVDHNVDIDPNGVLKNDEKIRATLPTIKHLLQEGAKVILMTHVGRPKGKVDPRYSTAGVAKHLQSLLPGISITHITQTVGPEVEQAVAALGNGAILYLENVRFYPEEEGDEAQQKAFGAQMALLAEFYVNEAFASCHTYEEASTCAVPQFLTAFAGMHLTKELRNLSPILDDPKRPLALIMSGAKMATKIPVIERFLDNADDILLGGCIANTFLAAKGFPVGTSKYEPDFVEAAQKYLQESEKPGKARIHIPVDAITGASPDDAGSQTDVEAVGDGMSVFDIGPKTADRYKQVLGKAGMIVWNGPMGFYEKEPFSKGSASIAQILTEAGKRGVTTILGGGDTVDFHVRYGLPLDVYSFVSTGGGAMLEFISGNPFPAFKPLEVVSKTAKK